MNPQLPLRHLHYSVRGLGHRMAPPKPKPGKQWAERGPGCPNVVVELGVDANEKLVVARVEVDPERSLVYKEQTYRLTKIKHF